MTVQQMNAIRHLVYRHWCSMLQTALMPSLSSVDQFIVTTDDACVAAENPAPQVADGDNVSAPEAAPSARGTFNFKFKKRRFET